MLNNDMLRTENVSVKRSVAEHAAMLNNDMLRTENVSVKRPNASASLENLNQKSYVLPQELDERFFHEAFECGYALCPRKFCKR